MTPFMKAIKEENAIVFGNGMEMKRKESLLIK